MKGSLSDSPLLRITIVMMVGMAAGRQIGSLAMYWGIATLALLLVSVLARRWERVASVALLLMAFSLGVFLIQNSDEHDGETTLPIPYATEVQGWMEHERQNLSAVYAEEGLQGDDYGIVAAMTLGEKERVSQDLKDVYSVSGAAHVFALSGMHLSIIFMLLALVLPMRRYRKSCTAVQMVALWTYVMLVGCHASVIRAAVMLSVYALGRLMTRRPDSISVLIFTAAVLLVIAPQWLFNVGFQMSFMAVLGICVCYSRLYAMVVRNNGPDVRVQIPLWSRMWCKVKGWAWGMLVLSLAAQMGTAPLVAHYFGRFSCYSLLTNYVVSPAALIVIALALVLFVCVAIASVAPWLGFMAVGVTAVLRFVVRLLNDYLLMITKMPYASVEDIRLNVVQTVLVYVIIACVWGIVLRLHHMYAAGRSA